MKKQTDAQISPSGRTELCKLQRNKTDELDKEVIGNSSRSHTSAFLSNSMVSWQRIEPQMQQLFEDASEEVPKSPHLKRTYGRLEIGAVGLYEEAWKVVVVQDMYVGCM